MNSMDRSDIREKRRIDNRFLSVVFHPAVLLAFRLVVGAIFIYAALQKIGKPLLFADSIHAYGILDYGILLYLAAIVLPWFELFCGLALVCGILLRGSALLLFILNAVFIIAIAIRTGSIVQGGTPFLEVFFDCGCGFGETYAWKKLLEDIIYLLITGAVLAAPVHKYRLSFGRRSS